MAQGKFVAYYRVSTARQGRSGLGLEAQRATVAAYLNGGPWELVGEFTEVETGKGSNALDRRPQLRAALDLCKREKATLLIAVLDRLARNVHFVSGLMESAVPFVSLEMPTAGPFELHIRAAVAEETARKISETTKAALAAAKARGVKLGTAGPANLQAVNDQRNVAADQYANRMRGVLLGLKARGLSQRAMIAELNKLGLTSPRGGQWHLPTLQRVMSRLAPEQRVRELVEQLRAEGLAPRGIVAELTQRGVFAANGKPYTTPTVAALLKSA